MDYHTAKEVLKTQIVTSFAKTKFRNASLRRQSLEWAVHLPTGSSPDRQVENGYHSTYLGSIVKFGKPGKEAIRERNPNTHDMTPILYEKRGEQLKRSNKGFSFSDMWQDIRVKIAEDKEAGHILLTMMYRSGVLDDHTISGPNFCYNPNKEVMQWLDKRFKSVGDSPPSELIPMYDAIMLNDDIKIYTNPKRYQSTQLEPYDKRGRINTMGAIFAVCASEEILSRVDLSGLLMRGRGTPRIFEKHYDYGCQIIAPMTGGIVNYHSKQERLV